MAVLLSGGAAAAISLRHRARRGTWWWLGANGLLIAGLALHAGADPNGAAAPFAALFALQWPIVTLAGVRSFYSRGDATVPAWADWLVLAVAWLAVAGTWLAPFDLVGTAQVDAVVSLAVTIHAAVAVSRLEDFATTATMKILLAGFVAGALAQFTWLAFVTAFALAGGADVALGGLLATAALAVPMSQLSLLMNHERQIAHLRASQRKLRHLVDVDPLTRLPNRRHFHELAERAVKVAGAAATILVLDVDRLKRVNDLLGHSTGDEALRQIGTALRETLRRRDIAGRLGGDEFAVVLPRTRMADAAAVVARINARLDDRQVAPRIARVVLNVGTVQMIEGESIADALHRAEIALEAARDQSRAGSVAEDLEATQASAPQPPARAAGARPAQVSAFGDIPIGEVTLGQGAA